MRCIAYDSTTISKCVYGNLSLLGTRHQGGAICAGSSDLCCSKGRNQRGSEHSHCVYMSRLYRVESGRRDGAFATTGATRIILAM